MDQLIESEMTFGPYLPGDGFRVEDSAPHKAAGDGVKIIEFYKLYRREGKPTQLWLVEAKTTAPKSSPQGAQKFVAAMKDGGKKVSPPAIENLEQHADWFGEHWPRLFPFMPGDFTVSDFSIYFNELKEKMENGLRLFYATRMGRHPYQADHWPETFRNLPLNTTELRLFVVIKRAERPWLPQLNDKLRKVMRPLVGAWGMGPNSVEVLTEEAARRIGLITHSYA
ncbi:MAG: hypothetical protein B7Z37_19815 [Verrucomicrobia bacterium 12-59-8]|nr:MAG: hypothetical protein B7Z37_19815 [Verrucomicrobia bacterium 12-59-8]